MTDPMAAEATGGGAARTGAAPRTRPEQVWRPVRARAVALVLAALVAVATVLLAVALPRGGVGDFSLIDRFGVVLVGAALVAALGLFARSRAEAYPDGLLVVNLLRSRRVAWAEIVGVTLGPDASWAALDLSDGSTLALMALQSADGDRARRGLAQLRALLAAHDADPTRGPGPQPGPAQP